MFGILFLMWLAIFVATSKGCNEGEKLADNVKSGHVFILEKATYRCEKTNELKDDK